MLSGASGVLIRNQVACSIYQRSGCESQTSRCRSTSNTREQILDLGQEVVRILMAIHSAMNMAKPINRLPTELLTKVFEFRKSDRDLISATHVCARWRDTLLSTPYLWTKIDFEDIVRASAFLERSKSSLIDVSVAKTRSFLGPEGVFLGAIPWVARMKSLFIHAEEEQIKTIAKRLCHQTPNLQSLSLKGRPGRFSSTGGSSGGAIYIPHEFLGRHAPLLQSLTFSSVSPSVVFNFPLPKLTHIDWVAETAFVAIEELLDLLATAPLLEVIKIHVRIRRTRAYEPLREVTLNKLRKLDWGDHEGSISLITCLIAPKLDDVTLRVTRIAQDPQITLSAILPPQGNNLPRLVEPKALEYAYRNGTRTCHFTYDKGNFLIREVPASRMASPTADLWLSPADIPLSFGRTKELTIEVSDGCILIDDIPIDRFENLRTLGLVGETDTLAPMIRPNRGISGGVLSVPCPDLSEVSITPKHTNFPLGELVDALRERKEAGNGLKTVRIWGKFQCLEGEIKELRKFVGELTTK